MKPRIVHVEIAGTNGPVLEAFYKALFGWEPEGQASECEGYGKIDFGSAPPPTAGIRHEPEGCAENVFYVEVDDVERSCARAQELGAGVRIPPMELPDLTFALLTDPEGNPFGIVQSRSESP